MLTEEDVEKMYREYEQEREIKMTNEELKVILENHKKWLSNKVDGVRADLRGADLSYANLRDVNLRGADLWGANLCDADLNYAILRGVDNE